MPVTYKDNSGQVLSAFDAAVRRALEIIGGKAETYAKLLAPVDTGLLRNSITHGLNGGSTSIKGYKASKGGKTGSYDGKIEKGAEKEGTVVVIGTNVEYAPYVELGTRKQHPKPYLRPAIEDHIPEYKSILEREVKNA